MTVPVVLAIAGVVALFLGVWGGGIKAKEIEIPPAPPKARVIVGVVGLVFIGISIWLSTPTSTGSQQVSLENPTSSVPTPTAVSVIGATVTRSQVNEWTLGETTEANVYGCLDKSGKLPAPEISFNKGDTVPKGALVAILFWVDGGAHWDKFPVKPICVYNDWGLFESTDNFQAINAGGYRRIVP